MSSDLNRPGDTPDVFTLATPNISSFSNAVNTVFMPLEITGAASDFSGEITTAVRDNIHCYVVDAGAHAVERKQRHIQMGEAEGFYKFSLMLEGSSTVSQDGRTATIGPTDLTVYDTARPYSLVCTEPSRTAVVMIPHRVVDLTPRQMDNLTAIKFDGHSGLGAIVTPMIRSLAEDLPQLSTAVGSRLARTVVDSLATVLAGEANSQHITGTRDELFDEVCEWIEARLGDPRLTPSSIAAAHFVSVRHLQALFQLEGITITAWIRSRRMEECHRDLTDPIQINTPVHQIGARWGYPKATHFSRAFREYFGYSPSNARELHFSH